MQNHKIQFATIDLAATAIEIREQLLQVIGVEKKLNFDLAIAEKF